MSQKISVIGPVTGTKCQLRGWQRGDESSLVAHANNEKIAVRLRDQFPHPYTTDDAKFWVGHCLSQAEALLAVHPQNRTSEHHGLSLAIIVDGEACGGIGMFNQAQVADGNATHVVEVGYWLGEAVWGRGVASEALLLFVKHLLDQFPKVERIEAFPATDNPASARILTKSGFIYEGRLRQRFAKRGVLKDCQVWSYLRRDHALPTGPTPSLVAQYIDQSQWRSWDKKFAALKSLMNDLSPSVRCVDLGCGPGELCSLMARNGWSVTGIDNNPDMIDVASKACPGAHFIVGDVLSGSEILSAETADFVISTFCLAYARDEQVALQSWCQLLAPRGYIAVMEIDGLFSCHTPQPSSGESQFSEMEAAWVKRGYNCAAGATIEATLRSFGLDIVAVLNWSDPELAFDGPAAEEVLAAWRLRFDRVKIVEEHFGDKAGVMKDNFLATLASPEHKTTTRLRMVLAQRR